MHWELSDDGLQEISRFYPEGVRQRNDVQEGDVTLASLDTADVVAMEVGQFCQPLLRQSSFEPESADSLADQDTGILGSHPRIMESLTTMGLHTISVVSDSPRPSTRTWSMGWTDRRTLQQTCQI